MATTARLLKATGQLEVFDDAHSDTVTLSRDAAGTLLVDGGAVPVQDGPATVANTSVIEVFGQGGNDTITFAVNKPIIAMAAFTGPGLDSIKLFSINGNRR